MISEAMGLAQRARYQVQGHQDRLLKQADFKSMKKVSVDGKEQARAVAIGIALSAVAFVPYAKLMWRWFYVYHQSLSEFLISLGMYLSIALFCIGASKKRASGKDREWLYWLGVLAIQSALVALIIGFFLGLRPAFFL